jgi:transposase InsO family protein
MEIVKLAIDDESNITQLSKRFGVSRKSVYNWINRYRIYGSNGLLEHSTRPDYSPKKTPDEVENLILMMRDKHPRWGARKLKRRLEDLDHKAIPHPSTINEILHRNGRISPDESLRRKGFKRFECDEPNEHWQMDFKGYFMIGDKRCNPLTILDDHSRYLLCLEACCDQRSETVHERMITIFRKYGLPDAIVTDNGGPWASPTSRYDYTRLALWLIRLGIRVIRIAEYHPQSNGKDERLHRTLKAEVLQGRIFKTFEECQEEFDRWRYIYNFERPHQALDLDVPSKRYQMSHRSYPEKLPKIEYGPDDDVRKVQHGGIVHFRGKEFKVSKVLRGEQVAIRPTTDDGIYVVVYVRQKLKQIDFRNPRIPPGGYPGEEIHSALLP